MKWISFCVFVGLMLCLFSGAQAATTLNSKLVSVGGDGPYVLVYDEDDMTTNSATGVPTQQSVKAYVDSGTVSLTNKTLSSPTFTGTITADGSSLTGTVGGTNLTLSGAGAGSLYGFLTAVSDKTATYTLTAADCGKVLTNEGASGTITIQDASDVASVGFIVTIVNADANPYTVNFDPDDADQILGATDAAGDQIQSTTQGDTVTLVKISAAAWAIVGSYNESGWADAN